MRAAADARMAERLTEGGDADLMLRLKAGELDCFEVLMNKYRRQMVHFMFRMVHNQAVAEEMAQEVFPAGISRAGNIPRRGQVYDVALPHSHQSCRKPRARHEERAACAQGALGRAGV